MNLVGVLAAICAVVSVAKVRSVEEVGLSMDYGMVDDDETEMYGDYSEMDSGDRSGLLRVVDVQSEMKQSPARFHATTVKELIRGFKCSRRGRKACSVNCSQGKFLHRDGCCTCACRKNYAKVFFTACRKTSWSKWGQWSKCIESKWGGIQTRERVCKSSGSYETPGACDGRGSMSKTCTVASEAYKIRKNVRDLTDEEFHDLIQAMDKFKKDGSKNGYRNIISWHGWPGRCPWYRNTIFNHGDGHCSWHHHPLFLPWHRLIMVQLETGLNRYMKNKTLGIPYWDWTEHNLDLPYLIRNPQVYDPVLKKYVKNPFHGNFIKYKEGYKINSQRSPWLPGLLMDRYLLKGTVRALLSHNYYAFDDQLATNPHDQIHNCFCVTSDLLDGRFYRCLYAMPTVTYAAWDPVFMLHHSAMDRIFVMRRRLEEETGVADWTESRVAGEYTRGMTSFYQGVKVPDDITKSFSWPLSPFCNKTMNPLKETNRDQVWTLHKSYYNEELFGYKYPSFDLGDYSWEDLLRDFKKNRKDRKYWNDYYFDTKLGVLTRRNSKYLPSVGGCVRTYSNPK